MFWERNRAVVEPCAAAWPTANARLVIGIVLALLSPAIAGGCSTAAFSSPLSAVRPDASDAEIQAWLTDEVVGRTSTETEEWLRAAGFSQFETGRFVLPSPDEDPRARAANDDDRTGEASSVAEAPPAIRCRRTEHRGWGVECRRQVVCALDSAGRVTAVGVSSDWSGP